MLTCRGFIFIKNVYSLVFELALKWNSPGSVSSLVQPTSLHLCHSPSSGNLYLVSVLAQLLHPYPHLPTNILCSCWGNSKKYIIEQWFLSGGLPLCHRASEPQTELARWVTVCACLNSWYNMLNSSLWHNEPPGNGRGWDISCIEEEQSQSPGWKQGKDVNGVCVGGRLLQTCNDVWGVTRDM